MASGRVPACGELAEPFGLFGPKHRTHFRQRSVECRTNVWLESVPRGVHLQLMTGENASHALLLRRVQIEIARETMHQIMRPGGDGLVRAPMTPLVKHS